MGLRLSDSRLEQAALLRQAGSRKLNAPNQRRYYPSEQGALENRDVVCNLRGRLAPSAKPAMNSPQDEEAAIAESLVDRIRSGDREAESELVERYSRGVSFLLQHRSGDEQLASDLHQETFCVVLIRLREKGLAEPTKLAAFIHRTAVNLFIGDYRKLRRRNTHADIDRVVREADPSSQALARVLQTERAQLVQKLISELRQARDRELLERFYLREESKQKLCEELELDHLHFDRVLFRARQRLKRLAQDHLQELRAR